MPSRPFAHRGRPARNSRSGGSAAAMAGCVGLPDPTGYVRLGDGGLSAFCHLVNERFDEMAATTRPEFRSFARAEREARCT